MPSEVDRRKVGEFLALTFGLSWTAAAVMYLAGVEYGTFTSTILLVLLFMWAPAVSAIAVRLYHGEAVRAKCGLTVGRVRWLVLAWLAPLVFVVLTVAVALTFPDVSLSTDYAVFFAELGLTDEQIEENLAVLESLPFPPVFLFVVQGLLVGATVNALAALGEELGWRGFLLTELSPLGFWKLSAVTGFFWGIWHAPIIVQGHNFPEAPLAGIAVMTVWTIAASPVFTYITVRAESVLAAAFFHGTFNAVAGLTVVYLVGAGNLLILPVGVAGIGAAFIAVGLCVAHDRYVADKTVTAGGRLSPWGD